MMVLRWILLVVSIVVSSHITQALSLPFRADYSSVGAVLKLFIGAAILAFVNATLGKLLKLLTLPLNCLTLGLFSLVINAAMLQLVGALRFGFYVESFWAALVGSAILSVINALLGSILIPDRKDRDDDE